MKEELLKIAQESLSSEEVTAIVKEKFMNALGSAIKPMERICTISKIQRSIS